VCRIAGTTNRHEEGDMSLAGKNALVYGGGGAIGGAIARAFAAQGATVAVAGRTAASLEAVVKEIEAADGTATASVVDALDEAAVEAHADAVTASLGSIDVAVNAVGMAHVQGVPLAELSLDDFAAPIVTYTRTHFLTARAVGRHMAGQGSGVLMTVSTPGSKLAMPGILGFGTACAAIEALTRLLAAELAPSGVRVVGLRPDAIPEAAAAGSHSRRVFETASRAAGLSVDEMLAQVEAAAPLRRLPTLAQVADAAAFLASDAGAAVDGVTLNLTAGTMMD